MKYLYSLLWLCTVFFFSCNGGLPDAEETEGEIEIFPDYKGVAVPCNIAPLNFIQKKNLAKQSPYSPAKISKYG